MATAQQDAALKSACCTTWTNPVARLLLGDRLHPGGQRTTALTLGSLGLERGARVLDLGCGPGLYTTRLAKLGHTCVGIDFSPASIAYAKAEAEHYGRINAH